MRRFVRTALLSIVATLTSVPLAGAQLMRDHEQEGGVRGFHGHRPLGGIKRSFQSDAEARAEFERIVAAVGLSGIADRITLRASAETPNAEAFIGKSGERFIFYNALFMQKVKQRTAEHWSLVSILAHEIGHHVRFHTEIEGRWHEFELEADYFSGFVLRRLGAALDQAQKAMGVIAPKEASQTHPGLDQRLQAITIGWIDAGASGSPRGPEDLNKPAPAPQSGADTDAQAKERERLALLQRQREEERQSAEARRKAEEEARIKAALVKKQQEEERQRAEARRKAEEAAARRDPALAVRPGSGESFRDCPECPEMVVVPEGEFTMGSSPTEIAALKKEYNYSWFEDEGPQRKVTMARPFAVGKFEVTFAEWDACVASGGCRHKPGDQKWGRDKRPVIDVSWDDAQEYVKWLSGKTGKAYRLLTEAEWEYAARGVTGAAAASKRYWWGNKASHEYANYGKDQCCGGLAQGRDQWANNTAPVGQFPANPFGLHDMHGNVYEWVQDCWHDNYGGAPLNGSAWTTGDCGRRVLRGGYWGDYPWFLRSASRGRNSTVNRDYTIGFRVGRTF